MQPSIFILDTVEKLNQFKEYVNENKFTEAAFDLETNDKNEVKAVIWGIGVTFDGEEAFYIPLRTKTGELYFDPNVVADIVSFVSKTMQSVKMITHNGLYDILVWEYNTGVDLTEHLYADTILYKHLVDEERPFGLKETAVKYLGAWADKAQTALYENIKANGGSTTKDNLEMWKADTQVLGEYCGFDVILTYRLYKLFRERIEKEGLVELLESETMPLYRNVTIVMKRKGVTLDIPMFLEKKEKITEVIKNTEVNIIEQISDLIEPFVQDLLCKEFPIKHTGNFPKAYAQQIGMDLPSLAKKIVEKTPTPYTDQQEFKNWLLNKLPEDMLDSSVVKHTRRALWVTKYPEDRFIFNLASKAHLKWLFFDKLGEKPLSTTDKGEPQVDDAFLESIKGKYAWIEDLQDYNVLNKMSGTYIQGMLDREVNGKLYTSFLQFGTTSGRFASSSPNLQNYPQQQKTGKIIDEFVNAPRHGLIAKSGYKLIGADFCLHPKTELLTRRGWVGIMDTMESDEVWQVNPKSLHGSWSRPLRVIKRDFYGTMHTFGNRRGSLSVTENHTMLWTGQKNHSRKDKAEYRKIALSDVGIPTSGCHIMTGSVSNDSVSNYTTREIWIACALQADGSKSKKTPNTYRIEVSNLKKRNKLTELFGKGILNNFIRDGQTQQNERWRVKFESELLDCSTKTLNLENLGANQVEDFISALSFWDASFDSHGTFNYFSTDATNVDQVQRYLVRAGYEAKLSITEQKQAQHRRCYNLAIRPHKGIRLRPNIDHSVEHYVGPVGCVTVPEGFILVRSENQTFVTGNCALEPNIAAFVSGDSGLIDIFVKDLDFYSAIAIKQFNKPELSADKSAKNYLGNLDKALRNKVKTYSLATFYGASAPRISQVLNCSREEAQELLDGYLDSFPGIREFIEKSHHSALTKGYVKTIFGRVRHLQQAKELYECYGMNLLDYRWANKNNLLEERGILKNLMNNAVNFQIQGTAGHIMNKAMLKTVEIFKEKGIDAYPIMQIHDEQIIEVREDQAEIAAELAKYAMETAVDISPIKLKAEPIIGNSYGECK